MINYILDNEFYGLSFCISPAGGGIRGRIEELVILLKTWIVQKSYNSYYNKGNKQIAKVGFKVLRFTDEAVLNNINGVIDKLEFFIAKLESSIPPPYE